MVGIPKSILLRAVQAVNQQTLNMLFSSAHKNTKLFNDRGDCANACRQGQCNPNPMVRERGSNEVNACRQGQCNPNPMLRERGYNEVPIIVQ